MLGSCGGSDCYPAKRRKVLPRQAPSITPGATSDPGTSSTESTGISSNDSGTVSGAAPTGVTTSSPAGPTGRQNPQDASSDTTDSASDGNSTGSTSPPSSSPPTTSNDTTSQPTSQTTTDTSTTQSTTTQTSSQTTTTSSTSDPTTSSPTSDTSSQSTTTSTSTPTSDSSSVSSSESSSQTSSPPTSPPTTDPTSLSPTPLLTETTPADSSTGMFGTTITSAISTVVVNGTTSTIFTQIPTTLSSDNNSASEAATKRNVIAGTVGGVVFVILITAIFLFYRRHQTKKVSFFRRLQPKPRTRLLDGEDMDDFDLGAPMTRYRDYPVSLTSSHAHSGSITNPSHSPIPGASPLSREFQAVSPGPSLMGAPMDPHRSATPSHPGGVPARASPPLLLGMRSESGSIFREAVWPPPGETSNLIDPLRVATSVDLSRIVDDVMGPTASTPTSAQRGGPPPSYRDARASGTGGSRTSDLVGDDPFATLTHSREASDAPLLPKHRGPPGLVDRDNTGSPAPAPKFGALFVTNMGPLSPSSTITAPTLAQQQALGQMMTSPTGANPSASTSAAQPRNWLQRSPKKLARPSIDEDAAVDVADLTSTGHGVGEAL